MKSRLVLLGFSAAVCMPSLAWAAPQTLQQAWVQAYQINPSLEAERAKLRATDEQVSQALSHWRPSVDATANIGETRQYVPGFAPFGTSDFSSATHGYGVQFTQPLFRGFRTEAETEAAEQQVLAGRAQLESAEQKLLLDTATAFLDIVRDQTILEVDRANEDVLRQKLDETSIRAQVGDLTQTDVRQSESRLARAQVNRLQTENTLAADRAAYARLVGDMPGTLEAPELALDNVRDIDDVLHLAKIQNPDVISAQYAFDQSQAEINLNKGSLLPELDLVGSTSRNWGQNSTIPGREDSSQILAQLTVPLYRSGADYSKTRAAQQTSTQRRLELEDTRHKAHEAAHNAWQSYVTAKAAIVADDAEVGAAASALEGVKVESKVGTRTTLDVLNAEQELLDAKVEMARAQHDKNLAILQIRSAIGELTANALKLPVDTYDPKHHYDDVRDKWFGFGEDEDAYSVAPKQ
jgi:outer membrane protein